MALRLDQVTIRSAGTTLIAPFSLMIQAGETVTLMGPSGAGKSTLLSYIAGDLDPFFTGSGTITLNGRDLGGVAAYARGIGRLFQDDLLFPHLTVGENLLFGMPRAPRQKRLALMEQALAEAGLSGFAQRPPHTLSGGQRARVAVMRALLAEPQAMLLDEPFNRLDAELRESFRVFVHERTAARRIPCLLVTHDRGDAPPRSRVLKLKDGEVRDD